MHLAREGDPLPVSDLDAAMAPVVASFAMTYAVHDLSQPRRVLVMVSQQGHCLNDLLFRVESGALPVELVAIVSNHEDFRALAKWHRVPFHHVPVTSETKPAAEAELLRLYRHYDADTIALARYMQILSAGLCAELPGRIINIHHSLLPAFSGADPYRRAYARGVRYIGATAHYVTADLDEGPIIEQAMSRIASDDGPDALIAQGAALECQALVNATRWHLEHRVVTVGAATVVVSPTTIANTEAVS
jgi:formyltetrahydrofolate deformylase